MPLTHSMFVVLDPSVRDLLRIGYLSEGVLSWEEYVGPNRTWFSVFVDHVVEKGDLEGVAIVMDVGGFTGTRILSIIANMFCYVRGIPVIAVSGDMINDVDALQKAFVGAKKDVYVSPSYSGQPHIG